VTVTITKKGKIKPVPAMSGPGALRVMGIDVSTDTGVVVLDWDVVHRSWRLAADFEINLPSLPNNSSMTTRLARLCKFQARIGEALAVHLPAVVAVEGYAFGHVQSQVTMVELGCAARLEIAYPAAISDDVGPPPLRFLEVAPSQLKKFVLGKGVGKKEMVMMGVFKRWGYEAKTNNLADAYVLAQIAASADGLTHDDLTKPQMEVLTAVLQKNS